MVFSARSACPATVDVHPQDIRFPSDSVRTFREIVTGVSYQVIQYFLLIFLTRDLIPR